jgi:hypothetical protein
VSTRTVYRDWRTRNRWLDAVLEISDPKTFAAQIVASHQELKRLALKEYLTAENENARVGALNLARNLNMDLSELVNVPYLIRKVEALEEGQR